MLREGLSVLALGSLVTLLAAAVGWANWTILSQMASDFRLTGLRSLYIALAPSWPGLLMMLCAG